MLSLYFVLMLLSSHNSITFPPLLYNGHSFEVISLDLEVRYAAVSLRSLNSRMPQEILNGYQISISVQQLRRHGVA